MARDITDEPESGGSTTSGTNSPRDETKEDFSVPLGVTKRKGRPRKPLNPPYDMPKTLVRTAVHYIITPQIKREEIAPFVGEDVWKDSIHFWEEDPIESITNAIRETAIAMLRRDMVPYNLILHLCDETLSKEIRAWVYKYRVDKEEPFWTMIILHEKVGDTYEITGRYNL